MYGTENRVISTIWQVPKIPVVLKKVEDLNPDPRQIVTDLDLGSPKITDPDPVSEHYLATQRVLRLVTFIQHCFSEKVPIILRTISLENKLFPKQQFSQATFLTHFVVQS